MPINKSLFIKSTSQGYRLLALVLFSLVLMFADNRADYLSTVRYYLSYTVTPVHWLAGIPRTLGESVGEMFRNRNALLAENESLRQEILEQRFQLQKMEHYSAEIRRLNELLNASSEVDDITVNVQLIGESYDPFNKRVLINQGANDGVFVGQPVLDAYGLFGQVVEVEPYSSWVLLITDPQHATPVLINRTSERAVVTGTQESFHRMLMNDKQHTADIREGDLLVTSGLGQTFPEGYPVGVISSVVHDPGQPFAQITVTPTAQLDKSRNLLLVF